jgi:hypothetical protein
LGIFLSLFDPIDNLVFRAAGFERSISHDFMCQTAANKLEINWDTNIPVKNVNIWILSQFPSKFYIEATAEVVIDRSAEPELNRTFNPSTGGLSLHPF